MSIVCILLKVSLTLVLIHVSDRLLDPPKPHIRQKECPHENRPAA